MRLDWIFLARENPCAKFYIIIIIIIMGIDIDINTIMWPGQFTGTFLKKYNFMLQINGMNMNQKEKWKVTRQSSCGISQYRQIMKYKVQGQILFSWIKKKTVALLLIKAVLGDARIAKKEKEKIEKKYQDLRREIKRLWNTKAYVVPVVVGALGVIPKNLKQHLETIGVTIKVEVLQKAALLVTGRLLRKVLEA